MNRNKYYGWLLKQVGVVPDSRFYRYRRLMDMLFNIEFRWDPVIGTDSNRAEDGVDLRLMFLRYEECQTFSIPSSDPCTVLEMLVAMSMRMENDIMGEPGNNHPERWFWEMLGNLKLLGQTDDKFDSTYVSTVIGNWLSRAYEQNGVGGLFPVRGQHGDQRRTPIWEQMGSYLTERY